MKSLVLDTSVFIKLRGSKVGPIVEAVLRRHTDCGFFVCDMTCFEFIRTCPNLAEARGAVELLNDGRNRIPVDKDLLAYSTYYFNVLCKYMKDDRLKNAIYPKHLSDSDVIIGASALRMNAMLCTTNGNDFPRPFFNEVSVDPLGKDEKLYVLQADRSFYEKQFGKLMK